MKKNTALVKSMALAAALTMVMTPATALADEFHGTGSENESQQTDSSGMTDPEKINDNNPNDNDNGGRDDAGDEDSGRNSRPNRSNDNDEDVEIEEEEVPLADFPELEFVDEPVIESVEIGDEEVPLAEGEDVLLAGIPKTGDASLLWMALSGISGLALAARRRK